MVTILTISGYDRESDLFTDISSCGINLILDDGTLLARWSYAKLLTLWQKKHSNAVYVPAMKIDNPLMYQYGGTVRMGIATDVKMLFRAFADDHIVYDPGHKVENVSGRSNTKARTQFRIASKNLGVLYQDFETVDLRGR